MSAIRAGIATYNEKSLLPRPEWGYGAYRYRLARYAVDQAYFDNTVFSAIEGFSALLKSSHRLYRDTRALYNPVNRVVGLIVANVYQGQVDPHDLSQGALPLTFDNDALQPALSQLMQWSNLGRQLPLLTQYAALYGEAGLWVVDDRFRNRVRLEVLHPAKIKAVEFDEADNVKACVLEWEQEDSPDVDAMRPGRDHGGQFDQAVGTYMKTIKVTREQVTTYKNGEPFAYYQDFDGTYISEWDNEAGFVPLVLARYSPTETGWGKNCFYHTRGKINDLNDFASLLVDQVRNTVVPLLKTTNIKTFKDPITGRETSGLKFDVEDRTGIRIIRLTGENANIEPLVIPLDIAAAREVGRDMLNEIERDLPELVLQSVRDKVANPTAPGMRMLYSDAFGRLELARQNLDPAVVSWLQMGVTLGGINRYAGFEAFDADSYDRGDMDLALMARPVFPDQLSKGERIDKLAMIADMPKPFQRKGLRELDYGDADIDDMLAELEAAAPAPALAFSPEDLDGALSAIGDLGEPAQLPEGLADGL